MFVQHILNWNACCIPYGKENAYGSDLHSKIGACNSKFVDIPVLVSSWQVQLCLLLGHMGVMIANIRDFSAWMDYNNYYLPVVQACPCTIYTCSVISSNFYLYFYTCTILIFLFCMFCIMCSNSNQPYCGSCMVFSQVAASHSCVCVLLSVN